MSARAAVLAALTALVLVAVSGCSATAGPAASTAPAAPAATATDASATEPDTAPVVVDGLGLAILQNRPDYGARRLQLSITNETDASVMVTAARFSSPQFTQPVAAEKSTDVPAGLTRYLPVALPDAVCPAPSTIPELTVTVTDATGASREVTARPADPFGVLDRIAGEDCLDEAVAAVATLRLADTLEVTGEGPDAVAHLALIVEPRPKGVTTDTGGASDTTPAAPSGDGPATLHLDSAASTILLEPADGADWPIELTVSPGDAPTTITLDAVPARCDPHAIAEDKRGTFVPVTLELSGGPAGTVSIPSADPLRLAIYAYLANTCGFAVTDG
ncbi:hypothetical protein ITJ64_15810 [Herbiconiux sp. VKM Ac-1786]|uniref:hypothetical protein n=1 Tax=Herbiconiux sp. VKM Ac-1786 TaxID=2783824 RepID=UPI00188A5C3F|nr:hypothetical protein [Herbiconiux sp. VKM Ac-1786]MBF4573979.1 hypothetical protein [Herbiconiux sp. VKM Ac-1786]